MLTEWPIILVVVLIAALVVMRWSGEHCVGSTAEHAAPKAPQR